MTHRLGRVLLGLLVLAMAVLLGTAAPASAHSQIVSSTPSNGERLDTAPQQLTFVLSEPADLASVAVSLAGPSGPVGALGEVRADATATSARQTLLVPVTTTLDKGLYRLTFKARSSVDGHTSSTQVIFGVGVDVVDAAGDAAPVVSPLDTLRTVAQGLGLVAAGLASGLLLLAPVALGRGRRTARVAAIVAAGAAALGGLLWHEGNGLVVAGVGIVGALGLYVLARRIDAARVWQLAVALVLAVAPLSLIGHAAAQGTLMTAVSAVHLVTTAAWVGVVVATVIVTRDSDVDRRAVLTVTSRVGGATFLASLATGLLLMGSIVPSIGGLVGSWYGRGLISKMILVVAVLALAAYARVRLQRGRVTSVRVEALLLALIAGIAIVVATLPPPQSARYQPTPAWEVDTAAASVPADDLLVSLGIDPNFPGTRFFVVRVADTRRPAPAPVTAVTATVGAMTPTPMQHLSDGSWSIKVDVSQPGPRAVHVDVARAGLPVASATTTWTVAPTPGTLSGGGGLAGLVTLALIVLVVATLLGVVLEYLLATVDVDVRRRMGRRMRISGRRARPNGRHAAPEHADSGRELVSTSS